MNFRDKIESNEDVKLPDNIIEMIMPLIDDKLGLTGRLSSVIQTDGRTIYSPFSPDKAIRIRILAGILMKMCSINDEKVSEMYIRRVFKLILT